MSITVTIIEPRIELTFADDDATLASQVDADTVMGTVPGATGLVLLATATVAAARAALNVIDANGVSQVAMARVGAHETSLNPHRQYIGQAQAVLSAAVFGA